MAEKRCSDRLVIMRGDKLLCDLPCEDGQCLLCRPPEECCGNCDVPFCRGQTVAVCNCGMNRHHGCDCRKPNKNIKPPEYRRVTESWGPKEKTKDDSACRGWEPSGKCKTCDKPREDHDVILDCGSYCWGDNQCEECKLDEGCKQCGGMRKIPTEPEYSVAPGRRVNGYKPCPSCTPQDEACKNRQCWKYFIAKEWDWEKHGPRYQLLCADCQPQDEQGCGCGSPLMVCDDPRMMKTTYAYERCGGCQHLKSCHTEGGGE